MKPLVSLEDSFGTEFEIVSLEQDKLKRIWKAREVKLSKTKRKKKNITKQLSDISRYICDGFSNTRTQLTFLYSMNIWRTGSTQFEWQAVLTVWNLHEPSFHRQREEHLESVYFFWGGFYRKFPHWFTSECSSKSSSPIYFIDYWRSCGYHLTLYHQLWNPWCLIYLRLI